MHRYATSTPRLLVFPRQVRIRTVLLAPLIFFHLGGCSHGSRLTSGIVRSSNVAFRIHAPENWTIDDSSDAANGLPCVLYLKNLTWESSPAKMYATIVSPAYKDVRYAISVDTTEFRKYGTEDQPAAWKRLDNRKIDNTLSAIVYDYEGSVHKTFRRVAYIQVPDAVCCIAFSAQDRAVFQANVHTLDEVIESFELLPEHVQQK